MPKKGWKTITVREELAELLADIAEKMDKSIQDTLQAIVEKHQEKGA